MCFPVWFCLPQCGALFIGWCWFGVRIERTGKAPGHIFWGHRLVLGSLSVFAPPGAVPVVGGYLYPSVLRSPGVTPQKCRAAHGPIHPAVTSPPRLCWVSLGWISGYSVWFSWSLGLEFCLVWCPLGPDPCQPRCLFVLSLSLVVWYVRRRRCPLFLSLSLSLRRWGNPNPF